MKKILIIGILFIPSVVSAVWWNPFSWYEKTNVFLGGPSLRYERSLLPVDSTENLGTTTAPWDELHVNQVCLSTNCRTSWPTGGGGSGGGTFSTSTAWGSVLYNYPNNASDIVTIGYDGSGVATSTNEAEYSFDPIGLIAYMKGKLGIGTTSPMSNLSVVGSTYFDGNSTNDAFTIESGANQHAAKIMRLSGTGVHLSINDETSGFGTSDGFDVGYDTTGDAVIRNRENSAIRFITNATEKAALLANGFFGIGTTTPYAPLSVVGQVVGEYFTATSSIATSTINGKLNVVSGTQLGTASSSYSGSSLYVNQKTISTDPDTDPVVRIESFGDDTGEPLLSIVGGYRNGVGGARYRSEFHSANPGFLTNGVMLLNGPDNNNSGDLGDNKLSWNLKPDYFQFGQATQMLGISTDVAPYSSINVQQSHGPFLEGWSYANTGFQNSLVGRTISINSTGKVSSKTGYDVLAVNASSTFNGSFTAGGGSSFNGVPNIQERLVRIQGGLLAAQTTRNNSTLSLGYGFEVKQPVTVSQLGRYWASGNSLNHGLWLWDSSGSALLASTTVLNSSTSDDNGFKWADTKYNGATITVDLVPNHMYYVTSDELSGGDLWLDKWSVSGANLASVFAEYMVSSTTPIYGTIGSFPTTVNGANYQIWSSPAIRASSDASTRGFHISSTTAYIMNHNFGIGSTTPGTLLSLGSTGSNTINISATATSTFGSGLNLRSGCFAINGTCIGGGTVSSGGGSGNVATSTGETAGNLAYWTSTNGTPATLGKISTTTVTCSGDATCTPFTVIGNTPIDISASAGAGSIDGTGLAGMMTSWVDGNTVRATSTIVGSNFHATSTTATSTIANALTIGSSENLNTFNIPFRISKPGTSGNEWLSEFLGFQDRQISIGQDPTVFSPKIQSFNDNSPDVLLLNPAGGNVGIGTTSPYTGLSVSGQVVGTHFGADSNTASRFPNASTTNATVSSNLWITPLTSALIQTNAAGLTSEYAGTTCNDSVITSLTALGIGDCVKVDLNLGAMVTGSLPIANLAASTISGISLGSNLANLTATDSTLTFSGTYNGSTARTIGLNLANANSWTARQNFLNASSTLLSSGVSYFGATATTTISGDGSISMPSGSTFTKTGTTDGCATWASGVLGTTGTACGSGGGGGSSGGTWSTTTSTVSGRLVNYSNNNSDIVAIGSNSTTTAEFFFDPNVVTANIGNSVPPQLSAFGTGYHPFMIASTSNDVIGMNIFNRSAGSQAGTGIFFAGANTPIVGAGAAATYYGGLVHVGPNFNGVPLGFGAATPNSLSLYNTDGSLILGSATSTGQINFYTGSGSFGGGTPDMLLNSSGNLGVGTSSPYARLSVVGEAVARNFTATSTTATSTLQGGLNAGQGSLVTDFTTGITSISSSIQGTMNFEENAGAVQWADLNVTSSAPNGTPQKYEATIDSIPMLSIYSESNGTGGIKNAGVGIGTSSPGALFAIQNTANAASSTYSFYVASTTAAFATTTHFVISNTGNVGLATTSPWRTLSVVGTAAINGLTTSSGTPNSVCINSTTKEITENAALTCTVSDEEQKSPLKALDFSALDMISEIKPSSFSYNDQPDRLRYGFGAQSLQAVDPRLADGYDKDGIARSIDLPALTAINTKAIQELAARDGTGGSTQDKIQWIAIVLLAGWCTVLTIKRKQ